MTLESALKDQAIKPYSMIVWIVVSLYILLPVYREWLAEKLKSLRARLKGSDSSDAESKEGGMKTGHVGSAKRARRSQTEIGAENVEVSSSSFPFSFLIHSHYPHTPSITLHHNRIFSTTRG